MFRQTVASWLGDAAETLPPSQSVAPSAQTTVSSSPAETSLQNPARAASQGATAQPGQSGSPSIVPSQTAGIQYDEILLPQASLIVGDEGSGIDPKIQIYAPSESLPTATARATAANSGLTSLQEVLQAFPKGVRDAVQTLTEWAL